VIHLEQDAMPLLVDCIHSAEDFAALAPDWQRLFASTGSHLPFWTFDWAQSWWTSCRRHSWATRDALRIYTVRERSGVLVGVAPMMLTQRPARGPLRARWLQFLGADPNLTELKGVVCSPDNALRVHESLLLHLRQHAAEWDWLQWASVDERCWPLLADQRDAAWQRKVPAYVLALPDSWEALKHGLKRNIRESLRKCYNSLKRDGHEFQFVVAHEPEQVASMLAHLFRLHGARSSLPGTVAHADVFATEHSRRFLLEVCERLARRGHWRAFTLRIAGQVVAIRLGFRFGDALYLYYSGYDPPWGRYSVMTTTVAEAIKHSICEGIRLVNLSTGNDLSKTRWGPIEVNTLDVTLCAPGLRSRLAHRAYRFAHAGLVGVSAAAH
jgi:CelD/BcsL family acetyltransferase involved in cellulose biosynthesis